jgi:PhoH-like ATPase
LNCTNTFVVDTNIIVENPYFFHELPGDESLVYIFPAVIQELDKIKDRPGQAGKNAREFIRFLDGMPSGAFRFGHKISDKVTIVLSGVNKAEGAMDQRIIQCAAKISGGILLTNDANMRLQARTLGLTAVGIDFPKLDIVPGIQTVNLPSSDLITALYSAGDIPADEVCPDCPSNQNYILKSGSQSALAVEKNGRIELVRMQTIYGVTPMDTEQIFAANALMDNDIRLVVLTGVAGSGKTLLSLAAAMAGKKKFQKIFITRPTIPLSNKDLGFLPGDLKEKIDPHMQPLYDNFSVLDKLNPGRKSYRAYMAEEKIEICPLAYIRGRSIPKVFFIVDEAQNLTLPEIKTVITRAGTGTKIVLTGDISQIDHPKLSRDDNGLYQVIERFSGHDLFARIALTRSKRSRLAALAAEIL